MSLFAMLFANENGEMQDYPAFSAVGRTGTIFAEPLEEEMIPLPEGASLTLIPHSVPIGINRKGKFAPLRVNPYSNEKERVYPVGALLPQGFTRLLLPGSLDGSSDLPLLGYTAVGVKNGQIYAAAVQTDEHRRWHPEYFNTPDLEEKVEEVSKRYPSNRIIRQLSGCALEYGCFTAQNIFYGRWEGGIPVSPACNAQCLGCISLQESECCPSPQQRIDFIPTDKEIVELALFHFSHPKAEIISFGQGCEGEPSLQADLIADAMKQIRSNTAKGTININTNAGYFAGIKKLCDNGLDAARVSLISATPEHYHAYYRPKTYTLEDVKQSLKYAAARGVFVSLNYLVFPGFSDTEQEINNLINLVKSTGIRMIQLRNLNIRPELFFEAIPSDNEPLGMLHMINSLKEELPGVALGNYSRAVKT